MDKFLSHCLGESRSTVKDMIRKGQVTVNSDVRKQPEYQVAEETDIICCQGKHCAYRRFVYYMLHKPAGVVSASTDKRDQTVLSLLAPEDARDVFAVGRLDKDTTGLLLLTNDGMLTHRLLAPESHLYKTYLVETREPLSEEAFRRLAEGVDIGDATPTLPARVEGITSHTIHLSIREGRYHQIKRMLCAVDNEVTALHRISFGPLMLGEELAAGEYRKLTDQEITALQGAVEEGRSKDQKPGVENNQKSK